MIIDLHTHTSYCDGKNTPEEMVVSAIEKNVDTIGICIHSYTPFDESYCIKKENIQPFLCDINRLKKTYEKHIKVLSGIEKDFYSNAESEGFDYVIGSVHYIKNEDVYTPIDESSETLLKCLDKFYQGDALKMAKDYFLTVSKINNADFIGHFDLITKFNEKTPMFDINDEKYVSYYKNAIDILINKGIKTFEINTGAISRGYRTTPYPDKNMINYIKEKGGNFVLSSDAHQKDTIAYKFDEYIHHCK